MTYQETVDYLYNATPQFQLIGAAAYKPGLETARRLDEALGHPHRAYKTIHVAGTNGKGSTCHSLAAILQSTGYRVGLYTSPHLFDFRERIKIDGRPVDRRSVIDFTERYIAMNLPIAPSFFELTTLLAFDCFKSAGVDIAVIETGLGGRLDTTNIISPVVTAITNISRDHMAQLGDTLEEIAREKAGIIKEKTPIIIGNAGDESVKAVFTSTAATKHAPIIFAADDNCYSSAESADRGIIYRDTIAGDIVGELSGACQPENTALILSTVKELRRQGIAIPDEAIVNGMANVVELTGLSGRWMKVGNSPATICDTGHNEGGWHYLSQSLSRHPGKLHMIIGFVSDKDIRHILTLMPRDARYYFTRASVPRAMDASALADSARSAGLDGEVYPTVADAYHAAKKNAAPDDMIFIGGSTFVVADFLREINGLR